MIRSPSPPWFIRRDGTDKLGGSAIRPVQPSQEELDRMRADSIAAARAAAEEARREEEAARRAEEARRRAVENARETLTEMVFFEYDMSRITPEAEQVLRQKVAVLRASPNVPKVAVRTVSTFASNEFHPKPNSPTPVQVSLKR